MEKKLFGGIPTITLQNLFYKEGSLSWLDFLSAIFYFLHFALPLAFGYILWLINRKYFKQFVTAILLLSYSAWLTFLIFPAAPPWLAGSEGYLPKVHKIMDSVLEVFPDKWDLPTVITILIPIRWQPCLRYMPPTLCWFCFLL